MKQRYGFIFGKNEKGTETQENKENRNGKKKKCPTHQHFRPPLSLEAFSSSSRQTSVCHQGADTPQSNDGF